MKTVVATRQAWERPPDNRTRALAGDDAKILRGDAIVTDAEHNPVVFQSNISREYTADLARLLNDVRSWNDAKMSTGSTRLSGFSNANLTFGFGPPVPMRQRYGCTASVLWRDNPPLAAALERCAVVADAAFAAALPGVYAGHRAITEQILPSWRFRRDDGVPLTWTSGIVNRTAALPYHRDSGNLIGSWSAMVTLRRGVNGGRLHLPEWDLTLGCEDSSVTIFDGQGAWHGVTPITKLADDAYRYTIVYYAKRAMCGCLEPGEESVRAALRATKSADDIAGKR